MHLHQIVVADVNDAILKHALAFLYDWVKVLALVNVIHVKTVLLHVLHQILRTIPVITHLQGKYLVFLDKLRKPPKAVVVIDVVVARRLKQSPLNVNVIRHAVPLCCLVDALGRQEELADHIQLPALLDHDTARREVSRLRQVNAPDAVRPAKVLKPKLITAGPLHGLCAQPRLRAVLLDVAVFGYKLRPLR